MKNTHYLDLTIISAFDDKPFVNKISDKYDYLKIALFDIWLSNEDRNYNNSNLLLNILPKSKMEFIAFDHGAIFNTSNLHNGLYIINDDDTILNTDICKKLFSANKQLTENVDMLLKKFYLYIEDCQSKLDEILQEIPETWNIDVIEYKRLMENQLFSKEWTHQCEQAFRKYIQLYIIN